MCHTSAVVDEPELPARPDSALLARLFGLLKPHRRRMALALLVLLAASITGLLYPQALRMAIDDGIQTKSIADFDMVAALLLAAVFVHSGLVWLRHYLMSWLGERVVADLRAQVTSKLFGLPLAWCHARRTGEVVGRLASDVTVIEGVVGSELSMALRNVIQFVGAVGFMLFISAKLTAVMLVLLPPLILVAAMLGRRIRRFSKALQDALARASGQVQEALGAIHTVQAFGREPIESAHYQARVEEAFGQSLRLARWRSSMFSVAMGSGYLAIASIVYLGGRLLIAGDITAGDLTAFFVYTFLTAGAIAELAGLWNALRRASGATERLFDILETTPDIRTPDNPIALPAGAGHLVFRDVQFAYPSRPDHAALRGLTLDVIPGKTTALVGPSGGGKSTLLYLAMRFFDADEGSVSFEGVPVGALALGQLRGAMAMVPQDPVLLSGTLKDNIAYGMPNATSADVEAAAREAAAHNFITQFPEGYQTQVGERGVQLSGGQRQRIALARALIRKPRLLLLDEATSQLDAASEAEIQTALARIMNRRTTLIVAHRLSTIRNADQIAVVEDGRIVERGTHAELVARAGAYADLLRKQENRPAGRAPTEPAKVVPSLPSL